MKKQIATIILGIMFISLSSAIYGGECSTIDLSELESQDNLFYTVIGNSSNLEGMNISVNNLTAKLCFAPNYKPDNFTLLFLNKNITENKVIIYSKGKSHTKYIEINNTDYIKIQEIEYIDKIIEKESTCNDSIGIEIQEPKIKKLNLFQKIWIFIKNIFSKH